MNLSWVPRKFDHGWLFILAGLAICVSTVLLPARQQLNNAEYQLRTLQDQEAWVTARRAAYDRFLEALETREQGFIERLASWELNLLPHDQAPILHDVSARDSSTEMWIESSVQRPEALEPGTPVTMLSGIAHGPYRSYFLAAGIACVFFGLLVSVPVERHQRNRQVDIGVDLTG